MVEHKLKTNIYFRAFKTNRDLKMDILDFITRNKADRILFKGNPCEMKYKQLKKLAPIEPIKNDNVREFFIDFFGKNATEHCIIYKK